VARPNRPSTRLRFNTAITLRDSTRLRRRPREPRLEDLSEIARQGHLKFPAFEHDDSPFTPMTKLLAESKLALVTTAGLHVRGVAPFNNSDQSYRVIPAITPVRDIVQSHPSIGFDRTAFMRDINISFPVNRLNELAAQGVIGSLSTDFYSFMGALRNPPQDC
jgi:D-proline reductase (dithiol) PrdB